MKQCVKDDMIGKINYIYSNRLSFGKIRDEENVLWSFGPHDVSMILSLIDQEYIDVNAQMGNYIRSEVSDLCSLQIRFTNNVKAHINLSWLNPFKEHRLVAIGTKGMMVFEDSESDWDKKLQHYIYKVDKKDSSNNRVEELKYIHCDYNEPMKEELGHFIDCITHNKTPLTGSEESLRVIQVISDAERSILL